MYTDEKIVTQKEAVGYGVGVGDFWGEGVGDPVIVGFGDGVCVGAPPLTLPKSKIRSAEKRFSFLAGAGPTTETVSPTVILENFPFWMPLVASHRNVLVVVSISTI